MKRSPNSEMMSFDRKTNDEFFLTLLLPLLVPHLLTFSLPSSPTPSFPSSPRAFPLPRPPPQATPVPSFVRRRNSVAPSLATLSPSLSAASSSAPSSRSQRPLSASSPRLPKTTTTKMTKTTTATTKTTSKRPQSAKLVRSNSACSPALAKYAFKVVSWMVQ